MPGGGNQETDRSGVMGALSSMMGKQAIFGMDPKEAAVACVFQVTDKGERVNVFPEALAMRRSSFLQV